MIARRSFLATTAAMGAVTLSPARLLAQSNTITIPIRLTDDRVLIDCLLNGQGPWPLVVDTGGSVGLIEQAMVDRLELKTVGKSPLGLIGAHRVYDMVLVDELSLGGVVREAGALFAATDHVNFIEDAVGSLAAGVVTTMDSELDFGASQLRLYPSGAPDRSGWTRVEDAFVLEGNRYGSSWMFAPVTIGGQAFPIGLDTGSPTELRLSGEALEKSGLWEIAHRAGARDRVRRHGSDRADRNAHTQKPVELFRTRTGRPADPAPLRSCHPAGDEGAVPAPQRPARTRTGV